MKHISDKYLNLERAKSAGLLTPQTILLGDTNNTPPHLANDSIDDVSGRRFIIRSIQDCEDQATSSHAGHFWSSEAVLAEEVPATITLATQKNQEILDQLNISATPQLMLQEYIEHTIGGVLFHPWSFFSQYSYIEYSTENVQCAVSGQAEPAMICLDAEITSPLPLPENLAFLVPLLRKLTLTLTTVFNFPVDCEWAYSEEKQAIVVLQVRPQTRLVGALFNAQPETINQIELPDGNWQYTALSESLDRLSPLSFSLLEQLYHDAKPAFKSLGYRCESFNFMQHLPDGTVLVDPEKEQAFFSPTLLGGFWRSFRTPQWQQRTQQLLQAIEQNSVFSYEQLSELFQCWMVANILSQGSGRDKIMPVHAYELSWQQNIEWPEFSIDEKAWAVLNQILRDIFFYQLEKLKRKISTHPELVFLSWQQYYPFTPQDLTHPKKDLPHSHLNNQIQNNQTQALSNQHSVAPIALYDFSAAGNESHSGNIQSIGAKKESSGRLFIIQNPSRFQQNIPKECILITPWFDNRWVHDIQHINGIIVEKGGRLSHSAIVAREKNVPYFIMPHSSLDHLQQGQSISISPSGLINTLSEI